MRRFTFSILIGLLVGLAVGLTLGWVILPVQQVDIQLKDISLRYRDDYTIMVAEAFGVDNDLQAAVNRLKPLDVSDIFTYVRDVTQRYISQSGTGKESDIRNLVALSCAMGYCTSVMQPFVAPALQSTGTSS